MASSSVAVAVTIAPPSVSTTSTSSASSLDFEALLSRDYQPARVTRLVPRESYIPINIVPNDNNNTNNSSNKKNSSDNNNNKKSGTGGGTTTSSGGKTNPKKNGGMRTKSNSTTNSKQGGGGVRPEQQQQQDDEDAEEEIETMEQIQIRETSRLVLRLVTQTMEFQRHLPIEQRRIDHDSVLMDFNNKKENHHHHPPPPFRRFYNNDDDTNDKIAPIFHEIELGDWESKINWEGCTNTSTTTGTTTDDMVNEMKHPNIITTSTTRSMDILKRPRNPYLDNIRFDESTVSWDGDTFDLLQRAERVPLILELGVAGKSIARHVYKNTVLSAQRPSPAIKSESYQRRMDRDWAQKITSTADVSKGTLHADKDKMEALIEARQQKRAQMAQDKTTRVTEAMGTLALGGGRGRTITSSLMGPGGTERTGRPARQIGTASPHESEYIEQLDLVTSHSLVRDLSKLALRQYHRPKLPMNVVRQDLFWQFQIRFTHTNSKKTIESGTSNPSSYQTMMMGSLPGAISKAKLRTEADLSPTEGKLILLEYSEERPLVQITKGMASKIVNYYRGDRAHCPVSAGGGDRPSRRKRPGDSTTGSNESHLIGGRSERPPRLTGPNQKTTVIDWIGKLPKKTIKERTTEAAAATTTEAVDILPEGVTEMLHPKVHGPFMGEIEEGTTVTALISNLFVAPMFLHEPETTDFLMILTTPGGASRAGQRESMRVVLRDLPSSIFTVGQAEPRTRVYAPNTQGEKNFVGPFVSYQISRTLSRTQAREGHGLRFDELQDRVLPNLELPANALRQRLKQVAVYDKNTQIWTTKSIGYEDYPGVEALGRQISPEGVAAFETACAASRRLSDLGIHQLLEKGSNTVASVGVIMIYLAGQLNANRELFRKMKKLGELSKTNKNMQSLQIYYYEKAASELENLFKTLRQKHEVAQFIFQELQLAPWHLTGEFIDVHKKGEGTGMLRLTGLGDPSGQGEAISFLREADAKPSKALGTSALNSQIKKITGTEDDLRKLTMKQMASLLRSYGMGQKQIDTLKRWDRVHVIRDLSTKAASDGIGDGLERFARGEKMKLAEQKQMYRDRVQVIWRRQMAALSMDSGPGADVAAAAVESEANANKASQSAQTKKKDEDNSDSDSDDDDDDLAATLEEEMMDRTEANQLVAAHTVGNEQDVALGQLRAATQDQELNKDARELAALKRQREEERAAQEGMQSLQTVEGGVAPADLVGRKVIRKRVTKTHPDGRQVVTFKFIVQPQEVGKIMARLQQKSDEDRPRNREFSYEYGEEERPLGHAMFEDEDQFDYSSKGRNRSGKRRGINKARGVVGGRVTPRGRPLQIGKLKSRVSKEERIKKRKREEDELEVYSASSKRKGTNNRKERGSIRERQPHVIYAEKLEAIRAAVEARPYAGPFLKPVNRRIIPRYYEVISHPIDLQTIKNKISKYEYRSVDTVLRDFELMKSNAIKFNGPDSPISQEAIAINEFVRDQIEISRSELTSLEEAVNEQMSGKPKKKLVAGQSKKSSSVSGGQMGAGGGGVNDLLGDLGGRLGGSDSDSDESFMLDDL